MCLLPPETGVRPHWVIDTSEIVSWHFVGSYPAHAYENAGRELRTGLVMTEAIFEKLVQHFTGAEDMSLDGAQRKFEDCGDFLILFLFNMP